MSRDYKKYIYISINITILLLIACIYIDIHRVDIKIEKMKYEIRNVKNNILKYKSELLLLHSRYDIEKYNYNLISKEHIISLQHWNDISKIL